MKKILYLALAIVFGAATYQCTNNTAINKTEETDSIRQTDSMAAVDATDSIAAFNDSIAQADSAQLKTDSIK